jgi:hypothetical protein
MHTYDRELVWMYIDTQVIEFWDKVSKGSSGAINRPQCGIMQYVPKSAWHRNIASNLLSDSRLVSVSGYIRACNYTYMNINVYV